MLSESRLRAGTKSRCHQSVEQKVISPSQSSVRQSYDLSLIFVKIATCRPRIATWSVQVPCPAEVRQCFSLYCYRPGECHVCYGPLQSLPERLVTHAHLRHLRSSTSMQYPAASNLPLNSHMHRPAGTVNLMHKERVPSPTALPRHCSCSLSHRTLLDHMLSDHSPFVDWPLYCHLCGGYLFAPMSPKTSRRRNVLYASNGPGILNNQDRRDLGPSGTLPIHGHERRETRLFGPALMLAHPQTQRSGTRRLAAD